MFVLVGALTTAVPTGKDGAVSLGNLWKFNEGTVGKAGECP